MIGLPFCCAFGLFGRFPGLLDKVQTARDVVVAHALPKLAPGQVVDGQDKGEQAIKSAADGDKQAPVANMPPSQPQVNVHDTAVPLLYGLGYT